MPIPRYQPGSGNLGAAQAQGKTQVYNLLLQGRQALDTGVQAGIFLPAQQLRLRCLAFGLIQLLRYKIQR